MARKASHAQSWYIVLPSIESACSLFRADRSVDRLTSYSVSVVEAFDDFWTEIVQWIGDVEAIRIVKGFVSRVHTSSVPAESLWAYSCEGGVVQIVAAIDKRKPKVDVVLSPEDRASEEKVAAIKACQMFG